MYSARSSSDFPFRKVFLCTKTTAKKNHGLVAIWSKYGKWIEKLSESELDDSAFSYQFGWSELFMKAFWKFYGSHCYVLLQQKQLPPPSIVIIGLLPSIVISTQSVIYQWFNFTAVCKKKLNCVEQLFPFLFGENPRGSVFMKHQHSQLSILRNLNAGHVHCIAASGSHAARSATGLLSEGCVQLLPATTAGTILFDHPWWMMEK